MVYYGEELRKRPELVGGLTREMELREQRAAEQRAVIEGRRQGLISNLANVGNTAGLLTTSAVKGVMQPALGPLKAMGMDTGRVLNTALDYYRPRTPEGPSIPNVGVGVEGGATGNVWNDVRNLEFQDRPSIPMRDIAEETAFGTGYVVPIAGAHRASGAVINKVAQNARPMYQAVARGAGTGALLGEGDPQQTLESAALFAGFEGAAGGIPAMRGAGRRASRAFRNERGEVSIDWNKAAKYKTQHIDPVTGEVKDIPFDQTPSQLRAAKESVYKVGDQVYEKIGDRPVNAGMVANIVKAGKIHLARDPKAPVARRIKYEGHDISDASGSVKGVAEVREPVGKMAIVDGPSVKAILEVNAGDIVSLEAELGRPLKVAEVNRYIAEELSAASKRRSDKVITEQGSVEAGVRNFESGVPMSELHENFKSLIESESLRQQTELSS